MERILSQDEVDALLRGVSDGDIETEKGAAEEEAEEREDTRSYDLTGQDRIIRGRMPTLEIINDRFARLDRVSLSGALRKMMDITVSQKDEMIKFGEFSRTLPVPTSIHILKMDPLRGHVLLVLESRLIFNLLDCFFGGTGRRGFKIEGREFTSIEQRVINRIVEMILRDLDQAWKPLVKVSFQYIRSEMNPQFASIVPLNDPVIVIHFDVELEKLIGKMILCLPYSTIEPIRSKLSASYQSDQLEMDVEWIQRLQKRLLEVDVELSVELGRTQIKGRDLLQLGKGDTIILDQDANGPLLVKVEKIPKFKASTGVVKGSHACRILEKISPPTD